MRYPVRKFDLGLFLSGAVRDIPPGYLRRAKGVSPLSTGTVKSRNGSTELVALTVHQATYFNNLWWYFLSTTENIQVDTTNSIGTAIAGSLGTNRPTFCKMPPTAGVEDYLFVCGEDKLIKFDSASTSIVESGVYAWTASGSGTAEYYLRTAAGGNTGIRGPEYVVEDATGTPNVLSIGTIGSLSAGQWVHGDNDALGYNTIYVRLTDSVDPDTKADGYLAIGFGSQWGIDPPDNLPTITPAAGNLTGAYKYRFTFKNSRTGTRSNANPGEDDPELALLLHMDGADEGTTFTDSGYYGHTFTAAGQANTEQATKKFGTASLEMDGNGDYISCPNHPILSPGENNFTIDFWFYLNDVNTAKTHTMFTKYVDANNYFHFYVLTGAAGTDSYNFVNMVNGVYWALKTTDETLVVSTWYHVAFIRGWGGDPYKIAIVENGTVLNTWTLFSGSRSISNGGSFLVGNSGASSPNGFIDEFRFVNGRALWTANFTAPTVAQGTTSTTLSTQYAGFTNLPTSSDNQVDKLEIWRTVDSGDVFFHLADIDEGTTSYNDNAGDEYLTNEELPVDNIRPFTYFDDCFGPWNGSMFWITRTQAGQRGRLFYSPIGRAEAVQGYIEITNDDDILQKITEWNGLLFVFSEGGLFQILVLSTVNGVSAYTRRKITGVPGTSAPYTVIPTANGIIYHAADGVRIYRGGTTCELLYYDAIKPIFRGETAGGIASFTGVISTFARNEYWISNSTTTIAVNVNTGRWRELGMAATCLAYSEESDQLALGVASHVYDYEKEAAVDDAGTDISFEIEVPCSVNGLPQPESDCICQRVVVDGTTGNETLTATLVYDGSTLDIGDVQHNGRTQTELTAGVIGTEFSVRLAGTLDAAANCVEIRAVDFDLYNPIEGK